MKKLLVILLLVSLLNVFVNGGILVKREVQEGEDETKTETAAGHEEETRSDLDTEVKEAEDETGREGETEEEAKERINLSMMNGRPDQSLSAGGSNYGPGPGSLRMGGRPGYGYASRLQNGDYGRRRPENEFGRRPENEFGRRPENEFGRRPENEFGRRPDNGGYGYGRRPENGFGRRPMNGFGRRPGPFGQMSTFTTGMIGGNGFYGVGQNPIGFMEGPSGPVLYSNLKAPSKGSDSEAGEEKEDENAKEINEQEKNEEEPLAEDEESKQDEVASEEESI